MREALERWRSEHTIEGVRQHYADTTPAYTVLEQATGGCLDTIAAAVAGFQHLGGTEAPEKLGQYKAKVFEYLTGAPHLGDARQWRKWSHRFSTDCIDYYKSGMPCTNYAALGDVRH